MILKDDFLLVFYSSSGGGVRDRGLSCTMLLLILVRKKDGSYAFFYPSSGYSGKFARIRLPFNGSGCLPGLDSSDAAGR